MIERFIESLRSIPGETAQNYKSLLPFFAGRNLYSLLVLISLLLGGYIIFRFKLKPLIEKRLHLGDTPFYGLASLVLLASPWFIGYRNPIFLALGLSLLMIGLYRLSLRFTAWLSSRKPFLAKGINLLLKFGIIIYISILIVRTINISKGLENLLFFTLKLGIFLIAIHILTHKEEVLSLLPEIDFNLYNKLKWLLARFYFLFLLFILILVGLWFIGYNEIAKELFWRFLGLTAFIIALSKTHQSIIKLVRERESLSPISREVYLLWLYLEILLSTVLILKLLGIYKLVILWLTFPLAIIGETPLYLLHLLKAILIGILFYLLALLLRKLIESKGDIITENTEFRKILSKVLFYTFIFIGLLASLRALGIGSSFLAVFAGTLGIGLGLGLQDLARNIVGGILIFMEGHFKINDVISLEPNSSSPITGKIEKIDYRCVTIRTFDNTEIIVPSSFLASSMVMNWTKSDPTVRRKITIGVSYNSDPKHVERILLEEAKKHAAVLSQPEPFVVFREMGESALIFDIFFWVDQTKVNPLRVQSDLNFSIWYRFREEGIEIPYPQIDVHIKR